MNKDIEIQTFTLKLELLKLKNKLENTRMIITPTSNRVHALYLEDFIGVSNTESFRNEERYVRNDIIKGRISFIDNGFNLLRWEKYNNILTVEIPGLKLELEVSNLKRVNYYYNGPAYSSLPMIYHNDLYSLHYRQTRVRLPSVDYSLLLGTSSESTYFQNDIEITKQDNVNGCCGSSGTGNRIHSAYALHFCFFTGFWVRLGNLIVGFYS